ncbi:hypothetical protein [Bradyrhizobium elkanii]
MAAHSCPTQEQTVPLPTPSTIVPVWYLRQFVMILKASPRSSTALTCSPNWMFASFAAAQRK